jgi:hypothetical protein
MISWLVSGRGEDTTEREEVYVFFGDGSVLNASMTLSGRVWIVFPPFL